MIHAQNDPFAELMGSNPSQGETSVPTDTNEPPLEPVVEPEATPAPSEQEPASQAKTASDLNYPPLLPDLPEDVRGQSKSRREAYDEMLRRRGGETTGVRNEVMANVPTAPEVPAAESDKVRNIPANQPAPIASEPTETPAKDPSPGTPASIKPSLEASNNEGKRPVKEKALEPSVEELSADPFADLLDFSPSDLEPETTTSKPTAAGIEPERGGIITEATPSTIIDPNPSENESADTSAIVMGEAEEGSEGLFDVGEAKPDIPKDPIINHETNVVVKPQEPSGNELKSPETVTANQPKPVLIKSKKQKSRRQSPGSINAVASLGSGQLWKNYKFGQGQDIASYYNSLSNFLSPDGKIAMNNEIDANSITIIDTPTVHAVVSEYLATVRIADGTVAPKAIPIRSVNSDASGELDAKIVSGVGENDGTDYAMMAGDSAHDSMSGRSSSLNPEREALLSDRQRLELRESRLDTRMHKIRR